MYIGGILISYMPINYEGLLTCDDRQSLQERMAGELIQKHRGKIRMSLQMPEFFVEGVKSKHE